MPRARSIDLGWHRFHAKLQRNDLQLPVSARGSPLGARHWARVVGAGQWVAAGGAAMSNTGKFADRTPGIRQAGLTSALANESSSACLDYPEPPSTPEGIKKWRKSLQQEPGKVLIHPGQMADRTYDAMHSRPLHVLRAGHDGHRAAAPQLEALSR